MSPIRKGVYKAMLLLAFIIEMSSCSDTNPDSVYSSDTGHPDGWIADHGSSFFQDAAVCSECHGTDLRGGISDVSCFSVSFKGTSCHPAGPPGHPLPFDDPDDHGARAKAAPGASSGFLFCKECHGSDFSGGVAEVSCFTCHGIDAPHSPRPWKNGRSHINTHFDNAQVCADCHFNDPINEDPQPGTPGCFNGTLCHGGVHDNAWTTDHSLTARTDTTSCSTNNCHGTDLRGGFTGISCYHCHLGGPLPGAGIMHPNRWADPEERHPGYLEDRNGDARSCSPTSPTGANVAQYCHGTNLLATSTRTAPPNNSWSRGPSCFECHGKEWSRP